MVIFPSKQLLVYQRGPLQMTADFRASNIGPRSRQQLERCLRRTAERDGVLRLGYLPLNVYIVVNNG